MKYPLKCNYLDYEGNKGSREYDTYILIRNVPNYKKLNWGSFFCQE